MSETATPESGALSVDQAVAALAPEPVEQQAPEAPAEAAVEPEPQDPEGETSTPEEATDEAATPAEEEEAEPEVEAVEPLTPPLYWSQEAKAKFADLPPDLQAVVLEQEGPREAATAKAKADAAAKTQAADAELGKVQQLASGLAERLPQWLQTFENRWGPQTPDWVAYAQENGVEAMTLAKTQYEQEAGQLHQAAQAKANAEQLAHQAFVKAEFARLAEIAPDLADPEKGAEKRTAVTRYLEKQGIPPEAIVHISAAEMTLAHKAMLYDQLKAAAAAKPAPKPAAPPAKSPVRPAAVPAQSSSRTTLQQAQSRFNLNPSSENAAALLLAKG